MATVVAAAGVVVGGVVVVLALPDIAHYLRLRRM